MRPFIGLPSPGTQIGPDYVISREIGRGAVGVVFEARRIATGESVAIKMLTPRSLTTDGVAERFEREAELSRALTSPHTVRVLSYATYGETPMLQGLPYMVMGMLRGESLEQHLATHGRLSEPEAVAILQEVLESLSEAHELGIVHRDLKPENIFLSHEGGDRVVKVLDFGVAKAVRGELGSLSRELTTVGMMLGTPLYMAPEQTAGKARVTPALDVYAVGCIAYHMLVGRPPYIGTNPFEIALKHIKEPVPSLAQHARPALAAVIERALAKEPQRRYPDARGLAIALGAAQASDDVDSISTTPRAQALSRQASSSAYAAGSGSSALKLDDSIFDDVDEEDDHTLIWRDEAIAELTYQQENSRLIPVQVRGDGGFRTVIDDDVTTPLPNEPVNLASLSKILWRAGPDEGEEVDADMLYDEQEQSDTEPMEVLRREPAAQRRAPAAQTPVPPTAASGEGSIASALAQDRRLLGILIGGVVLALVGIFSLIGAIVLLLLVD